MRSCESEDKNILQNNDYNNLVFYIRKQISLILHTIYVQYFNMYIMHL